MGASIKKITPVNTYQCKKYFSKIFKKEDPLQAIIYYGHSVIFAGFSVKYHGLPRTYHGFLTKITVSNVF
jgi:hypothetical protein